MVITLGIPTRHIFRLHNVITDRHLDNLGKMTLVTAWIVIYSYIIEDFVAHDKDILVPSGSSYLIRPCTYTLTELAL